MCYLSGIQWHSLLQQRLTQRSTSALAMVLSMPFAELLAVLGVPAESLLGPALAQHIAAHGLVAELPSQALAVVLSHPPFVLQLIGLLQTLSTCELITLDAGTVSPSSFLLFPLFRCLMRHHEVAECSQLGTSSCPFCSRCRCRNCKGFKGQGVRHRGTAAAEGP